MIISNTITKKSLETIVHETFSKFGIISSSSILDSLKFLGFYYATIAGISINIEDLKTPDLKKKYIRTANQEIESVSQKWADGFVSDTERFQTIIDSWNIATESLKNRIVDYYRNYDPTNNLYIMAFSGARGNMSQVRQLVGMRGLMSDQDGKIIDLPIQANFREGLSSIDYIISSYGARKGIVDTALKTADSGYLTRRLIYIAQDLIIREKDCKTEKGLIFLLEKKTKTKNIIGRSLLSIKEFSKPNSEYFKNQIINLSLIEKLETKRPVILNLRSSLTCKANSSICQTCYGWDLAHNNIVSLGEAVGIIAAQSIGEPGTQLTMRTFHTGGIFTGELIKQILASFSGKLILPETIKSIQYRTNQGAIVLKLQQEVTLHLISWEGKTEEIFLDIGSYLYARHSGFIRKGQLIAEYMTQAILPGPRKLKPIKSSICGEIKFENLLVRKIYREKRIIKINQDDGILWIAQGKLISIPKESKYIKTDALLPNKPIAKLAITIPYQGILEKVNHNGDLLLKNTDTRYLFNFKKLKLSISNTLTELSLLIKNYNYLDKYSIIGFVYIFPKDTGKIYSIRKKSSKTLNTFFFITNSDTWEINTDQVNDFSFFQDKKSLVRNGNFLNSNLRVNKSGYFLKKDGFKMIFQNAFPIFLSRGTILNYQTGDFILKKKVIATLVNFTQQTEDIVQGLPKIEELVEARKPKVKAYLSMRPGVIMNPDYLEDFHSGKRFFENNLIKYLYTPIIATKNKIVKKKEGKQFVYLTHSIFAKEDLIIFQNKIFKLTPIPSIFLPEKKAKTKKGDGFEFKILKDKLKSIEVNKDQPRLPSKKKELIDTKISLVIKNKNALSIWKVGKLEDEKIYNWNSNSLDETLTLKLTQENHFKNKRGDIILNTNEKGYIFLDYINPVSEYDFPLSSKPISEPGAFIDIGEPITEGIIDIHELLHILFRYHSLYDGIMDGTLRSLNKFQLLLVNSIQAIYQSQGVNISSKHIEIIVRQMTSKVVIKESGDTPLLPGELIRLSLINQIYEGLKESDSTIAYKIPKFEPLLLSATNASLSKDGFLSAAGFQETKRVLTKAAIEGTNDWLRGLKECIIIGRLIPAGSSFLNYKNYLDNIYLFKS